MKLYSKDELTSSRVFFDKRPPKFLTVFIIFFILLLIIAGIISSKVVKPYIVRAEGTVTTSDIEYVSLKATGIIESINVNSGDTVKAGDLLFKVTTGVNGLQSKAIAEQIVEIEERLVVMDKYEQSLHSKKNSLTNSEKELEYYSLIEYYLDILVTEDYQKQNRSRQLSEKRQELDNINREIKNLEEKFKELENKKTAVPLTEKAAESDEKKEDDGKDKEEQTVKNHETELATENPTISDTESQKSNIEVQLDGKKTEKNGIEEEIKLLEEEKKNPYSQGNQTLYQLLNELGQARTNLQNQLTKLYGDSQLLAGQDSIYDVVASQNGIVHYLTPILPGMAMQENQIIAEISNGDSEDFFIEAFIPAADRSKVRIGDEVKVAITGVNTNKFGTIKGEVIDIDQGTITRETSQGHIVFYRSLISIHKDKLVSKDNETIQIIRSMPIEARIVYEKENYLEWLLKMLNFKL